MSQIGERESDGAGAHYGDLRAGGVRHKGHYQVSTAHAAYTTERGRVVLGGRTGGSRDRWGVEQVTTRNGHGVFRLQNVYSGKCLDKSHDVPNANGNAVYLYTCSNADNQRWEKLPNGTSGWTQLKNVTGGRCLDVKGPAFSDAATIHVWDCYSSWSQRWNILP